MAKGHQQGSGLSLERFVTGKKRRSRDEATRKKKIHVHKAQRKREYAKIRTQERSNEIAEGGKRQSFYDRFFSELQGKEGHEDDEEQERNEDPRVISHRHMESKPDPFFNAKKQAQLKRTEREQVLEGQRQQKTKTEKKINERRKRHIRLSVRTASGQPVVRNHIKDILAKLEAERRTEHAND